MFKIFKLWLLLFLSLITNAYAEDKDVVAVLPLEAKGIDRTIVSTVMDSITSNLSKDTSFIVIENQMVDLMLKEQGIGSVSTCANLQCYIGIGHLLAVTKVIGGIISIDNANNLLLTLSMADVAGGELICEQTATASTTIDMVKSEIPKLVKSLLENFHKWENNKSNHKSAVMVKKRRRTPLKPLGLLGTGACIAGGGVYIYYKYIRHSGSHNGENGGRTEQIDIPISDIPTHKREPFLHCYRR